MSFENNGNPTELLDDVNKSEDEGKKKTRTRSRPLKGMQPQRGPTVQSAYDAKEEGRSRAGEAQTAPSCTARDGMKTRRMTRAERKEKCEPPPLTANRFSTSTDSGEPQVTICEDNLKGNLVLPSSAERGEGHVVQFKPELSAVENVATEAGMSAGVTVQNTRKRNRSPATKEKGQGAKVQMESPAERKESVMPVSSASLSPPPRGLASFGFFKQPRKTAESRPSVNKLFTPFVQDKRVVPLPLQFWVTDSPALKKQSNGDGVYFLGVTPPVSSQPNVGCTSEGHRFICGATDKPHSVQSHNGVAFPYSSFGAMIDDATTCNDACRHNDVYNSDMLRRCPCNFHVHVSQPRKDFCSEVVFCGFYGISFDPCERRPSYFGTYNNQDALKVEELMRLARFGVSEEMPRMSHLDYDYDSGDDWDAVEDDEDVGMSGESSSDEETDESGSSFIGSDEANNDFINDNDEYDNDSEAEVQRRMFASRERRRNRLKGREKFVPAFSGPFVGVSLLDHPLRDYDKFERISSQLNDEAFTSMFERCLRCCGHLGLSSGVGGNEGTTKVEDERQNPVLNSQRDKRNMTQEEVGVLHSIVAGNPKIGASNIISTLWSGGHCSGVSRAEMERTIRRYYERQRGSLLRREIPLAATDVQLFRNYKRKTSNVPEESTGNVRQRADDDDAKNISNNYEK